MRRGVALALAGLLLAAPVAAQPRQERTLIEQGRALRREGRNAAALEVFRRAYALNPTPEAAGQIGFAEHALQHWGAASRFLRAALGTPGDPWVAAQRRALEYSLQEVDRHLGSLRVESGTPGATITLDGEPAGTLPMAEAMRVAAGPVVLETRAPGHVTDRREVTVAAGETVRVVVQLAPEAGAPVATPVAVEPRVVIEPRVVAVPVVTPVVTPAPASNVTRVLGWVSLGFAAAAVGGGVAAMVVRDGAGERWNDDSRCLVGGLTREQNCGDDRALVSTAHDLMVGGYVAGSVLAVGAAVLFIASPSREAPRVSVGVGPGGVSVAGRF